MDAFLIFRITPRGKVIVSDVPGIDWLALIDKDDSDSLTVTVTHDLEYQVLRLRGPEFPIIRYEF